MTDDLLSPIPPNLNEPLTLQSWEAYRLRLERWCQGWDKQDEFVRLHKPNELRSSETLAHHPEYRGETYDEILEHLYRQVRDMQVKFMLYAKYVKPDLVVGPDNEEHKAILKSILEWSEFGGAYWYETSSQDLVNLLDSWSVDNFAYYVQTPHNFIALNRFHYAIYENSSFEQGITPTLVGFLQLKRDMELQPQKPKFGQWIKRLGKRPLTQSSSVTRTRV